jgi:hypothetical protein
MTESVEEAQVGRAISNMSGNIARVLRLAGTACPVPVSESAPGVLQAWERRRACPMPLAVW